MTNIRNHIYFNVDLVINDLLKVTDAVCLKVWKWIKERSSYIIWLGRKPSNMFKYVLNIRDISVPNNHLVVNPTHILIYSAICVLIMRRMLCILKSIYICYCLLYQQSPVPSFVLWKLHSFCEQNTIQNMRLILNSSLHFGTLLISFFSRTWNKQVSKAFHFYL